MPIQRKCYTPQKSRARAEPEIEWQDYPLIQSREYPAYCRFAKRYRDPGFRRWTCLLRFDVLSDDLLTVIATVPYWLSLGSQEKPQHPAGESISPSG